LSCLRCTTELTEEEDIYLARTVQHINDNSKHEFQEPGCQKTPRSTMLATQTHTIQFLAYHETTTTTTDVTAHPSKSRAPTSYYPAYCIKWRRGVVVSALASITLLLIDTGTGYSLNG